MTSRNDVSALSSAAVSSIQVISWNDVSACVPCQPDPHAKSMRPPSITNG